MGVGLEVYDVATRTDERLDISKELHGRRQIFTSEKEITRENVIDVLVKALGVHEMNRREIIYLQKYERGIQPVLERTKNYNAEINNKVVVNIANEIIILFHFHQVAL